jgi:hypothetical protein
VSGELSHPDQWQFLAEDIVLYNSPTTNNQSVGIHRKRLNHLRISIMAFLPSSIVRNTPQTFEPFENFNHGIPSILRHPSTFETANVENFKVCA